MRDVLSPSLMCCDLLHLEHDIRALERAGVDMLHYDIMDTTMTTSTMLPPYMLKQIAGCTALKLDIHLMSTSPELYLEQILPFCRDGYVSVHADATPLLPYILSEIRAAGAHPALALNAHVPLSFLEAVAPYVDMALMINVAAGVTGPRRDIDEPFARRIAQARQILDCAGRADAWLGVDGNVSARNARIAKRCGANVYVLGSSSIFRKDIGIEEACDAFRAAIKEETDK